MRNVFFLLLVFITTSISFAQVESKTINAEDKKKLADTTNAWKFGGLGGVTFNQAGFVNWAAGGTNSLSSLLNVRVYADYKKNKHLLQNWLAAEYGYQFLKQSDGSGFDARKNADRWEIFSKYGYQVKDKLYVGAYADLRSQFTKSFNYSDTNLPVISRFASPLIFEGAIGLDYVPNEYFSMFVSPLATKVTVVANDPIAATNAYGNKYPKKAKTEFGATLIAQYKQNFWKQNISVNSIFRAYKNYLKANVDPIDATLTQESKSSYRKNIDIDWQTTLGFKVNKFITASVFTHMIWDHDVKIAKTNNDGTIDPAKPRIQFRDIIGIGIVYQSNYIKEKGIKAKQL